ncbi:uncharacterized protein LOC107018755 [Solanum pennellii]|uniref:Uncharacterized protein LOC107018755 n=1 Tax=Solanum pennellii TaxID=28526 RepID=A0ABM1GRE7_SOLPN|nr:uncharacterized protein LOC107018755 [Solanum pennellii]
MEEELLALKENGTSDIVSCPSNVHPIRCKWVYSIKLNSEGTLDRYKARLVVLGLEVHNIDSGLFLNQHKYAHHLISFPGLQDSSSVDTPFELNVKYLHKEGDILPDPTMFRQLVGSLNYFTITRPDISFAVQQVSQLMQTPRHIHLEAVHGIIRYLLGTSTRGLFFPSASPNYLNSFSDSEWAGCVDTSRSVIGWCMFLG